MTDTNANPPAEQTQAPQQQAPAALAASPGEDYEKRYKGLLPVVEQRGERIKQLEAELAARASEIERLSGQISLKDVEKSSAMTERDKQIETYVQQNTTLQADLKRLQALEAKLKAAESLGRPELIKLAGHLPDVTDVEVLKTIMADIDRFADERARAREQQLTAGVTMAAGGFQKNPGPSTSDEWLRAIQAESDPRKRTQLLDDYGNFLEKTNKR